jgi:hypothetical protein
VYIRYISTGAHRLSPILSLPNIDISRACIVNNSTATLITESGKSVVLFDMTYVKIEIVEIKPDGNYRINETDDRF